MASSSAALARHVTLASDPGATVSMRIVSSHRLASEANARRTHLRACLLAGERAGLAETRRHNLAAACYELGTQAELARRLADRSGSGVQSQQVHICRVLSGERNVSRGLARRIESVMGWYEGRVDREWIERRQKPRLVGSGCALRDFVSAA